MFVSVCDCACRQCWGAKKKKEKCVFSGVVCFPTLPSSRMPTQQGWCVKTGTSRSPHNESSTTAQREEGRRGMSEADVLGKKTVAVSLKKKNTAEKTLGRYCPLFSRPHVCSVFKFRIGYGLSPATRPDATGALVAPHRP